MRVFRKEDPVQLCREIAEGKTYFWKTTGKAATHVEVNQDEYDAIAEYMKRIRGCESVKLIIDGLEVVIV